MKKNSLIIIVILSLGLLSGCNISETSIDDRLNAPKNTISPLEGKWTVTDYTPISSTNAKEESEYMGQPALFHRDALMFMNYYTLKPSFKMKKVNSVDYLLYKYKISAKQLGITSSKIEVYTVYNDNQLFMEVIKDEKDNLFLYMEDGFYNLEKDEDVVSLEEVYKYIDIEENITEELADKENKNTNSGILLGIKTSNFDETNDIKDWKYSTIWINTENKKLKEVYKTDDLLLPRKNGFWEINAERSKRNNNIYDVINARPQIYEEDSDKAERTSLSNEATRTKNLEDLDQSILKNILYLGTNHISIETTDVGAKNKETLRIHTIDNFKNDNSINLGDIIDNGKEIFLEGTQGLLNKDETVQINEENIGITRKNGYWMLKGRVNYKKNEEEIYKDFIIKAVPPEEMVGHDNHFIMWDELKDQFPNMIDMYSSPNEDIILIRDQFQLSIYKVDNDNNLNYNPIGKVDMLETDSIVMSEWATGKYTEIWRNEIQKRDIEKIDQ